MTAYETAVMIEHIARIAARTEAEIADAIAAGRRRDEALMVEMFGESR